MQQVGLTAAVLVKLCEHGQEVFGDRGERGMIGRLNTAQPVEDAVQGAAKFVVLG